jgi:hypothetical protein
MKQRLTDDAIGGQRFEFVGAIGPDVMGEKRSA